MEPGELESVLEALVRELGEIAGQLAGARDDNSADKVREARDDVKESLQACTSDVENEDSSGLGDVDQTGELVREARGRWLVALSGRDSSETRLRGLQVERAKYQVQHYEFTEARNASAEEAHETFQARLAREAQLLKECEELGSKAAELQSTVRMKSDVCLSSDVHGWWQNRRRRDAQRRHALSAAENIKAREILFLQRSTAEHIRNVDQRLDEVDETMALAQNDNQDRVESLRMKWTELQNRYRDEAGELQARLAELQRIYEERWTTTEIGARRRIEEKSRLALEARGTLLQRIAEVDAEREREAALSSKKVEEQKRRVEEARKQMENALQAKMEETRRKLQERSELESTRCGLARSKHLNMAEGHAREVEKYRRGIEEVSENYRARKLLQPGSSRMVWPSLHTLGQVTTPLSKTTTPRPKRQLRGDPLVASARAQLGSSGTLPW
mmetsp:Transcript_8713/g.16507  ORF Transcript_8713/g.16507 Transcript_8713/m.16507 type:complete len:447 (+) Transcript_8713:45-1385(+)